MAEHRVRKQVWSLRKLHRGTEADCKIKVKLIWMEKFDRLLDKIIEALFV